MSERTAPDMWVDPPEDPRKTGEQPVGEKETLWGYLQHYRLTLQMKCEELDAAQLAQRSVPPSTMSLLGLVRHLAQVEHHWFQRVLQGHDVPRLYRSETDCDHDFNGAVADPAVVEEAWSTWRREVAAADAWLAGDVAMDAMVPFADDITPVRDIVVHMIEEYARHVGHADLLRERIDGRTGQ
ncbi:MAG: DinB family protein [Nocardioidaceae bacterium]|nr:DinB family protein [Nocardioidaceae bacterium]